VKIHLEHVFPPIPSRQFDWAVYDDDTYDGAPDAGPQIVGYGATPEAAMLDFQEQLAERHEVSALRISAGTALA
jgi:hypothetical protein